MRETCLLSLLSSLALLARLLFLVLPLTFPSLYNLLIAPKTDCSCLNCLYPLLSTFLKHGLVLWNRAPGLVLIGHKTYFPTHFLTSTTHYRIPLSSTLGPVVQEHKVIKATETLRLEPL